MHIFSKLDILLKLKSIKKFLRYNNIIYLCKGCAKKCEQHEQPNNNRNKKNRTIHREVMILAIRRAPQFSPNSVEKDAKILEAVCQELKLKGHCVTTVSEEELNNITAKNGQWNVCLSMGRLPKTLRWLEEQAGKGCIVINNSKGIALCCNRRKLTDIFQKEHIPLPPTQGKDGYWLKRGDGVAETKGDVRFAQNDDEKEKVFRQMKADGIDDIVTSAHVKGDLIKFYGVKGSGFFRIFYPGDDGQSKFGDEQHNGKPHHYPFEIETLHKTIEYAAEISHTIVYGGDCIVKSDGTFCIIDFNDWPSFSRCREEAAQAIAQTVEQAIRTDKNNL